MEVQSSDILLAVMLHTYAGDIQSEKIVFQDAVTTALPTNGATVLRLTTEREARDAIAERQGGAEYQLLVDGAVAATGGDVVTIRRGDRVPDALSIQHPVALLDRIDEDRGSGHWVHRFPVRTVPASEPRCCVSVATTSVTVSPALTSMASTSTSRPASVTESRNHVGG
jgi:hypothetical protein